MTYFLTEEQLAIAAATASTVKELIDGAAVAAERERIERLASRIISIRRTSEAIELRAWSSAGNLSICFGRTFLEALDELERLQGGES